ncbi:hypothetical protein [Rivibacter subsaxonicus]|uniref:Uncharacterized protein n=1 Tax=Rivibacter subsaxonicus TaxID=457575 RepID=A0A4Q7VWQ4_9BURK|nr:hypothetical protein [Rivibacter subsaxonicus]RZU01182.1 hypothetical protein EV670_1898 [Rivibacter subsaxonicus]
MEARYAKTESGREEIRTRSRGLPRTTRNLLLMIDGERSSAYLLENLQGVGVADLEQLHAEGLIEAVAGAVEAPAAVAVPAAPASAQLVELDLTLHSMPGTLGESIEAAAPVAAAALPAAVASSSSLGEASLPMGGALRAEDREVRAAIEALNYEQLYKLLSDQARERLGMIRGYKLTLDIERAQSLDALRVLAIQFVTTVRELRGPVIAGELRRELENAA